MQPTQAPLILKAIDLQMTWSGRFDSLVPEYPETHPAYLMYLIVHPLYTLGLALNLQYCITLLYQILTSLSLV